MIVLGVLLLVFAVLVAVGIVFGNGEAVEAELFGVSLDNVSVGGLFLVGVVTGALAMLGLGLMLVGAARKRSKRVAVKREVSSVRGERESLAEENARLQAELERTNYANTTPVDSASDTRSLRTDEGRVEQGYPDQGATDGGGRHRT